MTDDGHAPTIPDTQAPPHGAASLGGPPNAPDPRYALRTLLGKGGMGEVWLAHDQRIDRDIAIKLMRSGMGSDDAVARFLREARVQGRLEHPSVVPVHDLGGDGTAPYFAMKRLTGTTLADVLAAGDDTKWPRRTLLARFVDVCLAIEFAHQRGVVHRDLKPANIMLGDFGEAYVLDWGLARITGDADSPIARAADVGNSGVGQTEAGAILGTPGYMAPEQVRGEAIDQRTDVFALGCVLFEILTGTPAISRDRALEQTLDADHHRPSQRVADVPPELDEATARATAAAPGDRYATARELADHVQRFLDGDRDIERRRVIAITHARRAQELLERGDEAGRAEAMREAGSAIALDASNRDAQAVLARLLLEPPQTIPAEALRKIDQERHSGDRALLRGAALAYVGFLLPIPVIYLLGVSSVWPLVVLTLELFGLIAFCFHGAQRAWRLEGALAVSMVVLHCGLLATLAIVVGPLLLVPILLFGSSTLMVTFRTVQLTKTILACHLMAITIPLALEWTGVIPASYALTNGGLLLKPWAIDLAPSALLFALLATVLLQLFANALALDAQRKRQDRAQEQLHVQAWQLAQLVPSSGSTK